MYYIYFVDSHNSMHIIVISRFVNLLTAVGSGIGEICGRGGQSIVTF